jgi:hypothetical protein
MHCCVSTTTVVMLMFHNVTWCVHCVSCVLLLHCVLPVKQIVLTNSLWHVTCVFKHFTLLTGHATVNCHDILEFPGSFLCTVSAGCKNPQVQPVFVDIVEYLVMKGYHIHLGNLPCICIMWNTTNRCTYRYVNLLYYKQRSLLHVSATSCGHLRRGVLRRIYYIEHQNNL